jgi:guanylate kinase
MRNNAMIIILSAPSGCGKSSIAKKLLETDTNLVLSISVTTRQPRPREIDGVHYFFKTKNDFKKLDYLESAEIYSNFYGTPREFVEKELLKGRDVLFDIDFQGAYQIMKTAKAKIVSIFILPPNIETLRKRMIDRGQDDQSVIEARLKKAKSEIEHAKNYDYIVINDDFDQAVKEIQTIILSQRNKKHNDQK